MNRILVMDDEAAVLEGFRAYLSELNFEVDAVSSLEAARERIGSRKYALVISDLCLSGPASSEGLDLLGSVRSGAPCRFALMTGYSTPEVEAEAGRLGADAFLSKPFDLSALDRLVEDLLEDPDPPRSPAAPVKPVKATRKFELSDEAASGLLARWVAGRDEAAFATIERTYRPLVHSIPLRNYRLPHEEAEEVYQEVMIQLLLKAPEIRNVRLWLIGTAINVSRRRFGGKRKHERIAEKVAAEERRLRDIDESAERETLAFVREEVDRLPPAHRDLMRAIYVEGLSYREISRKFGMPEGSIGPTRGRILRQLRSSILEDEAETFAEAA